MKKKKTAADYLAEDDAPATPGKKTAADYLAEDDAPAAPEPEKMGAGEAAMHGVGDYATGGFLDEAAGAIGAGLEKVGLWHTPEENAAEGLGMPAPAPRSFGEAFRDKRDQFRGTQDKAADDQALAYHGAGVVSSVLNPLGNVAKGASLEAKIGRSALLGTAGGLGSSRADLTKGDVAGVAEDAATGLGLGVAGDVIGAGISAGRKAIAGRKVNRLEDQIVREAQLGGPGNVKSTAIQNKKLAKTERPITDLVVNNADHGQGDLVRKALYAKPDEGLAMLEPVFKETEDVRAFAYKAIEDAGAGNIKPKDYLAKLKKSYDAAITEGNEELAKGIEGHANSIVDFTKRLPPGQPMTLRQLRGKVSNAQAHASGMLGGLNDQSLSRRVAERVKAIATGAMDDTLTEAVAPHPALQGVADTIRSNNKKYQAAKTIAESLEQKVYKQPQLGGLGERAGKAAKNAALGSAGVATAGYLTGGSDDDKLSRGIQGAIGGALVGALPGLGRRLDRGSTTRAINAVRGPSAAVGKFGRTRVKGSGISPMLLRTMGRTGHGKNSDQNPDEENER